MKEHNRTLSAYVSGLITGEETILTHSSSGSVRDALSDSWDRGKRFSVICTESRPAGEGTLLARHLALQGIPVALTTDALALSLLKDPYQGSTTIRLVLVGADSVGRKGVVNKSGTLGLATVARAASTPFYALAGSEKFLPPTFPQEIAIQDKPAEEILPSPPTGLTVINHYFDITPLSLVTAVITEKGVIPPSSLEEQLAPLTLHPQLVAALRDCQPSTKN